MMNICPLLLPKHHLLIICRVTMMLFNPGEWIGILYICSTTISIQFGLRFCTLCSYKAFSVIMVRATFYLDGGILCSCACVKIFFALEWIPREGNAIDW